MNQLNNWEKDLQRRFADHRMEPPMGGWEKLESALAPSLPSVPPTPFWRRPAFFVPAASAAACLAMVLLIDRPNDTALPKQLAKEVESVTAPSAQPTLPTKSSTPTLAQKETISTPRQEKKEEQATVDMPTSQPALAYAQRSEAMPVADLAEGETKEEVAPTEKQETAEARQSQETKAETRQAAPRSHYSPFRKANYAFAQRAKREKRPQPTLAFSSGFMPAQHTFNEGYYKQAIMTTTRGTVFRPNHFICSPSDADLIFLIAKNVNRKVQTDINHHIPVRVGLNVTMPLTSRWSIGTGLTYTLLKTGIRSGSAESYFTTALKLHYVGIPIQASYTFFQSRPFNAYATAGFMLEKCVKGKSTTLIHVTDSYKSGTESDKDLGQGLWQASFRLSAGMQFNLVRHVGIYFEPGVSYFVPDQSSLPSIRHDKPWQFDMEAGLRFTLGK